MEQNSHDSLSKSTVETEDGEEDQRDGDGEHGTQIKDVWECNLNKQMGIIAQLANKYSVIALDTEFPGTFVSKAELWKQCCSQDIEYDHVRQNVEKTKLIQMGLTLGDPEGNLPRPVSTWQFHFKFDLFSENIVQSSINMLKQAGICFEKLHSDGIPHRLFAQRFLASGLVVNKNIKWVVFHGSSDFSYLLRLLRNEPLPKTIEDFSKSIKVYFPSICDIKQVIQGSADLKEMGLTKLSSELGCSRVGPQHQAGSDSLVTLVCYFKLRLTVQTDLFKESNNKIFGFGDDSANQQHLYRMPADTVLYNGYYNQTSEASPLTTPSDPYCYSVPLYASVPLPYNPTSVNVNTYWLPNSYSYVSPSNSHTYGSHINSYTQQSTPYNQGSNSTEQLLNNPNGQTGILPCVSESLAVYPQSPTVYPQSPTVYPQSPTVYPQSRGNYRNQASSTRIHGQGFYRKWSKQMY